MQVDHQWVTAHQAWTELTRKHPELGYKDGPQQLYNYLRRYREAMIERDAIRRAKGRHWVAHQARFTEAVFELATGGPL